MTPRAGSGHVATDVRGRADLVFARRGARTVLAHSRIEAPMTVIRPFELPDGRLVVQLMEPGQRAEQHVMLRAGRDASIEYYPAVTIPFPGSALAQTLQVQAAATARVGVIETWAMGRSARDEYLQFRSLSSRTTLHVDGVLTYADAMSLEPGVTDVANAGVLAGRRYVAAGFCQGARLSASTESAPALDGTLVAFAQSTPDRVYLRALGDDGPELDAVLRRAVERVATEWGLPAVHMDRFRCEHLLTDTPALVKVTTRLATVVVILPQ